jgi:cell division protein FtsL
MTEILLKMALDTIHQQTNQSNINKTINDFDPKIAEHKNDQEISVWKYRSFLETGTEMWRD